MGDRRKIGRNWIPDKTDDISGSDVMRVSDYASSLMKSQREKLQAKCMDAKQNADKPLTVDSTVVEIVCEQCAKPFVCKKGELSPVCPHCNARYKADKDLEEVRITQPSEVQDRMREKAAYEESMREKGIKIERNKDWQDTRKEQISLEPGSPEYLEYLDDLQENDPMKEDDAAHAALENYNEDLVTEGYDATFDDNQFHDENDVVEEHIDPNKDTVAKRYRREIERKIDVHQAIIDTLAIMAAATPTLADDKVLRSKSFQTDIIHDRSITADEYKQAAESYVEMSM